MVGKKTYVPPPYIPLGQSDVEADSVTAADAIPTPQHTLRGSGQTEQWSSGICACFDDMQSCCVGLLCPCYLFGKNAEMLGSGTLIGSCMMHFILWGLVNALCCVFTEGVMFGFPGCFVACYAFGYRSTLRAKYNLQEAPCGDFITHFFCHLCAMCQEYREIRERSQDPDAGSQNMAEVTAPTVQKMESASQNDLSPRPPAYS